MSTDTHRLHLVPDDTPSVDGPRREPTQARAATTSWDTDPEAREDGRKLTAKAASAIAFLVRAERPDWSRRGIMDALEEFRRESPAEVAIAALACAQDPETRTPARLLHDGPWWARAQFKHRMVPPDGIDYSEDCPNHPGTKGHECRICHAARIDASPRGESRVRGEHFQQMRWAAYVKECERRGTDPGPRPF